MLLSLGGVPEWHLHAPGHAHHRAVLGDLDVVERRRLLRAGRGQLLVREADREAARVVLAHLGVGVARRRPLAEPRHVHAEDVVAGVALRHPVGDDEAHAAALAEARHHRAGDPEVRQPRHRPDQGVAVGGEGEGAVDHLLDPGVLQGRIVAEAGLQRRGDPVEVRLQQLVAEVPGRGFRRPWLAGLLVGAEQHAAALLPRVDLAGQVEDADHLAPRGRVELRHRLDRLGQQVHVLHREQRQLEPDHPPDLARPEAAGVDDVLGLDGAVLGDDVPGAVGLLGQLDDAVAEHDRRAERLRRLGVGVGGAGRVEVALDRVPERADEVARVHQREHRRRLAGGDDLGLHAEAAPLGVGEPQEVHALGRAGHHHAAGQVQPARLAGELLELAVEPDGIGLELRDVRVAVQRVEAAGGVPGRAAK